MEAEIHAILRNHTWDLVPRPCSHWQAALRILRYLQGTSTFGLLYTFGGSSPSPITLRGWSDSDWAGDSDSRHSTTGYVFSFGYAAISWTNKRQPTVALSSTEAEYRAMSSAT